MADAISASAAPPQPLANGMRWRVPPLTLRSSHALARALEAKASDCAAMKTCGPCYAIGCRYCEVGPVAWTSGWDNAEEQGEALDYTCILHTGENGLGGGCEQLKVLRPNTAYSRTIPQDKCHTLSSPSTSRPPPAPAAPATTQAPIKEEEWPISPIALPFMFLPFIVCCIAGGWWWQRNRKSRHVRVVPISEAAASYTAPVKGELTLPPGVKLVKASAPTPWTTSNYVGSLDGNGSGAEAPLLWEFANAGALSVHSIKQAAAAVQEAQIDDRRGTHNSKPRARCLAFSKDNNLNKEQLVELGRLVDRHSCVTLSLHTDWTHAGETTLSELVLLLGRGRCGFRVANPSIPEPLLLPLRVSPPVLASVAEAIATADRSEVSSLQLVDGLPGASSISLPLTPLRLGCNELMQAGNKLGDIGTLVACGFVRPWAARLQLIRFVSCEVGDDGAHALARLMEGPVGPRLKELNLSDNRIGDRGMRSIAEVLPSCVVLERLMLDRNNIGRKGVEALAKRLPRSEIKDLVLGSHLGGNPQIGEAGAEALAEALDDELSRAAGNCANRLQYLSLEGCAVGDKGAKAIAGTLPRSAVTTLSLARCRIGDEAAMEVISVLPESVVAVDLAGNMLTDKTGMFVGDTLALRPQLAASLAQCHLTSGLKQLLQEEHGARLRV